MRWRERRKCMMPDCEVQVANESGCCHAHAPRQRPCAVDGCENMVAVFNRSGYCSEHRTLGRK